MTRMLGATPLMAMVVALIAAATLASTVHAQGTSRNPVPGRDGAKAAGGTESKSEPVTIDADRMERFGKENLVVFTGKVVARQGNSVQYADRMEVYLDEQGDRVLRTVSTGAVRIVTRDCRTGTAKRAEYFDLEQRLVLSGGARVWQDENVVSGDTITIFLAQDRSVVQGGADERVKAVFRPKDAKQADSTASDGKASAAPTKTVATRQAATPGTPCIN